MADDSPLAPLFKTLDVDALVIIQPNELDSFVTAGARFGFAGRINDAVQFARQRRVLLLSHTPTGFPVDISLAGLPFEEECFTRALNDKLKEIRIDGGPPQVICDDKTSTTGSWGPDDVILTGAVADGRASLSGYPQTVVRRNQSRH